MKKNLFLFVLLFSSVWLSCCNKSEVKPVRKLDQQTKDYTVFLENSFWIYKLENQIIKDTIKINTIRFGNSFSDKLEYDYEENEKIAYSTYQSEKFYTTSTARSDIDNICISNMWFEGARTSTKCTFFSNRSVGSIYNYWYYPDNIVTYQEFLPTYTLEGKTYSEVMVFESRYTGASLAFDDVRLPVRVWYAKHVGIIRKEMRNGDFWNLISYEVKQ